MPPASPVPSGDDLIRNLSTALQSTLLMKRLHDPDHALSDESARQLVDSLEQVGFTMAMAADAAAQPIAPALAPDGTSDAERERRRLEQDDYLDEALQETFPASDPIAPGHPHAGPAD